MTDKEIIEKVWKRIFDNCHRYSPKYCYLSDYFNRVLTRYTRWLERAKVAWRDNEGRTVLGAGD